MFKLDLIATGDSVGVVLPKEILERLRIEVGDAFYAVETSFGVHLIAHDLDFARQMDVAEHVMRERRDVLRKLAE